MTARKGTDAIMLIDQFNFSGQTHSFEVATGVSEEDSTNLQSTAMEYEPILNMGKISQSGYINGHNANSFEAELKSRLGVAGAYVACLIGPSDANCPAYILDGTFGSSMKISATMTSLMTIDGDWGKGRSMHRGIRIFTGTLSATGAQTGIDLGAQGTNGGECYLFVSAISGTATNASIKVQSATLIAGSYSDEATFTVSAIGGYKATMTGTVDRWVRVNLASLGGATSLTFVMIVCTKGVTE